MLVHARNSLGPDWRPAGPVTEGDVRQRISAESGLLNVFAQQWNGDMNLDLLMRGWMPTFIGCAKNAGL